MPQTPGTFSSLALNQVGLLFDGSAITHQLSWDDNEGKISVSDTATGQALLANVNTVGATQTSIQSQSNHHDPLTIEGNTTLQQNVTLQGSTVQVQEGSQVLSGNSF